MYSTFSKYTQVLLDYSKYNQVLSDYSKYTQVLLQYSKNILKFYYTISKYYTQVSQGLFKPIPQFATGIKVYNRYCCCRAIEYILIRHQIDITFNWAVKLKLYLHLIKSHDESMMKEIMCIYNHEIF